MKLLVDEPVSWKVAAALRQAGYDAVHVHDCNLAGAEDGEILEYASQRGQTIITQDTDFGRLLRVLQGRRPSVVLLRTQSGKPDYHAGLLLNALELVGDRIEEGVMAVVSESAIRLRRLPL